MRAAASRTSRPSRGRSARVTVCRGSAPLIAATVAPLASRMESIGAEEMQFYRTISAIVMAFAMGFYDGFFGPGTGSFLIFGFLYLGYDFVTAAGNAKALNFASGVGALVSFAVSGTIIWSDGLIMAAAMIAGAVVGTRLAIKKGASYVRPLYLLVTTLLIGKQVYEILLK